MLASALQSFRLDPKSSYTEQVEHALRDAIVRGRLLPGTTLSEAAISAALGISRTPVREALTLLADEQLVLIYPQVRTIVAPVRRSLIDEGRFVRSTLECANHAELATTITEKQLEEPGCADCRTARGGRQRATSKGSSTSTRRCIARCSSSPVMLTCGRYCKP